MTQKLNEPPSARNVCEALLVNERSDRVERNILPSEIKVIDRLLSRGLELDDAYLEIHRALHEYPNALATFFDVVLRIAAFWHPAANLEARRGREHLVEINQRIATAAAKLSKLLGQRGQLQNRSGFSCDTHYHPVQVMHAAAEQNLLYRDWVQDPLESITSRFDLKYWPSLSDFVQVIADDAAQADPQPHDALTEAGTQGLRPSLADTFKAFFVALDESRSRHHGQIPDNFKLSDRSVATLMNCALDLGTDELTDGTYVKNLRLRTR